MASAAGTGSTGSPCGACKFLRRKCAVDCIFAPYFCSEQGPARFAAIHKVFGASNVSKLLLHVPVPDRCEAVFTIAYEAQARIRDPVYGCVAHIFALQQQVACLQAQLMQAKAQLAQNFIDHSRSVENNNQWVGFNNVNNGSSGANLSNFYVNNNYMNYPISPQSSLDSVDQNGSDLIMNAQHHQEIQSGRPNSEDYLVQACSRKRPNNGDLGELQALALRMMRN
ncbi:Lateral organ boundaries domain containing protein [Parasponia andersonii]|uniref:Lateral organ boundaries domain containing protein n=1 Tax=Parasponia andersonii TaxID=3476 RepID=A0A2P5CNG5_PARAD|nr:Lateral organ boundaries domain containing protein [Parasponia andersonii]